jgi:hypothetical protein
MATPHFRVRTWNSVADCGDRTRRAERKGIEEHGMDGQRFDAFVKGLAAAANRRRVVRALGGLTLGALFGGAAVEQAEAVCRPACGKCQTCVNGRCKRQPDGTACSGGRKICQHGQCLCLEHDEFRGFVWPFEANTGQWFIVNGYRGFVDHCDNQADCTDPNPGQLFGFDLAVCRPEFVDPETGSCGGATQAGWDKPATANKRVLAPVSGEVIWIDTEAIGIEITGEPGLVLAVAHVAGLPGKGSCVRKGQVIGHVSNANPNIPHIHMSLYRQNGGRNGRRDPVPFDGIFGIGSCFYPAGDPTDPTDEPSLRQYMGDLVPCTPGTCPSGIICDLGIVFQCGVAVENCFCTSVVGGEIRCGSGTCPLPLTECVSNDECESVFGPGYFCQPPGTGCCGAVCIAPCDVFREAGAQREAGPSNVSVVDAPVVQEIAAGQGDPGEAAQPERRRQRRHRRRGHRSRGHGKR